MRIKENIRDKNAIVFAMGGNCDCGDPEDGSYHLISCPVSKYLRYIGFGRLGVTSPFEHAICGRLGVTSPFEYAILFRKR